MPVLVYDGECNFCRRSVERIRKRDAAGAIECVPRQADGLTDRYPQLLEGDFNTGMRLIEPDGTVHVGADAMYHVMRELPRWRRLAWLYNVPGIHWLSRKVYAWIAANRYRLAGRSCESGACKINQGDV